MNKNTKKWLITASSLVIVGAIMFVAVMTAYHWDFSRLNTNQFETNTYEINEEFSNIKVNTESADILFAVSDDNKCRVVCYEDEKMKHSASVQDGTLTISADDGRKWYEYISFGFHSPKITVYLPKSKYAALTVSESTGDITLPKDFTFDSINLSLSTGRVDCLASLSGPLFVKTSTGDINLTAMSAGEINLTVSTGQINAQNVSCKGNIGVCVSTGDIMLTDISCGSISSKGATGGIALKNAVAKEKIFIERSTGDVWLEECDASEIEIDTDTGNVMGSLLSSKVFIAHSDTGSVDVPETTFGGKCKITTDTGDIHIKIK